MKILFLSPYVPTPIRTRAYNFVRELARRNHAVTLATVWENDSERRALADFEEQGIQVLTARLSRQRAIWNMLSALPSRAPVQSAYNWQPSLKSSIAKIPFEYDLIHVEHLRGARYGLSIKSWLTSVNLKIPIIWDSVDCITYLFEQAIISSRARVGAWRARFELGRTRRYERFAVGQFDRVLVTSAVDKSELGRIAARTETRTGENHISVVPNGVDLDYVAPPEISREPNMIVMSGKMSYHANATAAIHLANEIMPRIWAMKPEARLWIVGANPSRQIRQLASSATRYFHSEPQRTIVTGTVPDIRDYLARATVAVAPIVYGAGVQNKVLEAMAMGTPVVATSQAVSALQVRSGENVLIADDDESFARAVVLLLNDPAARIRIGLAGRKYVELHHVWTEMVKCLEKIYEEEISKTYAQI